MKKRSIVMLFFAAALLLGAASGRAVDYYYYDGSQDIYGTTGGYDSLDGTWRHDNLYSVNYDNWDGTAPGDTLGTPPAGPHPGGVGSFTTGGNTFLRIQDAGDPVDYGYTAVSNNRNIQFVHQLSGASSTFLEEGPVTLIFKIRLATPATGPIDMQYPDGGAGTVAWPASGIGYHITDGGHGMITLCEGTGNFRRSISFSLVHASELAGIAGWESVVNAGQDVLIMNNLAGTDRSGNVDSVDISGYSARNYVTVGNASVWNTFKVTITPGGTGTHQVVVSINGGTAQGPFDITVGNSSSLAGVSYLGIGCGASYSWGIGAFDLDYIMIPGPVAAAPDPAHNATRVAIDLSDRTIPNNLSWQPPVAPELVNDIIDYDLYLDPNMNKVIDRDPTCLIVQTHLAAAQYNPPANFAYSTQYYWAVDVRYHQVGDPVTVRIGEMENTWSFQSIGAAPEVNAGNDIITALQLLPASLAGTVTDATNDVASVTWSVVGYPGDAINTTVQMMDRGGDDGTAKPDLLRDWIGTRTQYSGDPMVLTISGLPAGTYIWQSYHHDPHNQSGVFDVTVSDANGDVTTTDIPISTGNISVWENISKFNTNFVSDGSDVRLIFDQQPYDGDTTKAYFVMNGFQLDDVGSSLLIDFGQSSTPVEAGYAAYLAEHEVLSSFVPQNYSVFGATVTLSVEWGPAALGQVVASVTPTNSSLSAPTASFTGNAAGTYTIQLKATDAQSSTGSDTMEVFVGANTCVAAQAAPGWTGFNPFDVDDDCDVDLADFAAFAAQWLDDRNLTGQI